MNETEQIDTGRSRRLSIYAWIIIPSLLLVGLVVMTLTRGQGKATDDRKRVTDPTVKGPHPLAEARNVLAKQSDLATCRGVVSSLNNYLQKSKPIEPLPTDRVNALKTELGLDDKDVSELNSPFYTTLDAAHLEGCFLLRDAARSLEVVGPGGRGVQSVVPSPLERARIAFDWVCRQVRLVPPLDPMPAPPAFVLRRGSGTPLERGVAFLALLEQLGLRQDDAAGLQGCLLFVNDKGTPAFWACGVVPVGEPDRMYLFDPRLGMPLPGPGGKGIATLKEARDNPEVLKQLAIDKLTYDTTAEQVKEAEARVFAPLTALAPRMRLLQDKLLRDPVEDGQALPAAVRVKLAEEEPGALAAIRKAFTASGGKAEAVGYWREGAGILRRFIPEDEGGSNAFIPFPVRALKGFTVPDDPFVAKLPRRHLHQLASVPWEDFPELFRDPERFRFDIGIGREIRGRFAGPFLRDMADASSPRDRIIRGDTRMATAELVGERETWSRAHGRQLEEKQQQELIDWINAAVEVEAAQLRAGGPGRDPGIDGRRDRLWRWRAGSAIEVFMASAIAEPRGAEVTYQLGLCKHEQAQRAQLRYDLGTRAGLKNEDEARKVNESWGQAVSWWEQYQQNYAKRAGAAAARRMLAEAQLAQGQPEKATANWKDTSGLTNDLEKLAMLWQAKNAKAQ